MKKWVVLLFIGIAFYQCTQTKSEETNKLEFRDIYDEHADAYSDIANAVVTAQNENKRIILMFGADWCPWCQRLHHTFETDKNISKVLHENYELVMIDLGKRDHNMDVDSEYGQPNKLGLPALVVLDQDGSLLVKQETGSLEYPKEAEHKGHDPEKLIGFLNKWKIAL